MFSVDERYANSDIEGILWAYRNGVISRLPDGLLKDYSWFLNGSLESSEATVRDTKLTLMEELESPPCEYLNNHRTGWAAHVLKKLRPSSLMDYACWLGGQSVLLNASLPSLDYIHLHELNHEAAQRLSDVRFTTGTTVSISEGGLFDLPDLLFDAVNAQEILEHVFDLDQTLEELRKRVKVGGILLTTFPFGPWEAQSTERVHVRLVLPDDVRDLFPSPHIVHDLCVEGDHNRGWTMAAIKVGDAPFGKIDMLRHWERPITKPR